jgi:hypothetical protein
MLRAMHAHVVRWQFAESVTDVGQFHLFAALRTLTDQPSFVEWIVVGEPGRNDQVQITTFWEAEDPFIANLLSEIATEVGAQVLVAGGAAVLGAGVAKSPLNFQQEQGKFHFPPDVTVHPGAPWPKQPPKLACKDAYYVYASDTDWVANCNAYGPGGANNPACTAALAEATKFANGITCPSDCPKAVSEIFRGWSCGPQGQKLLATGAVELEVTCPITP